MNFLHEYILGSYKEKNVNTQFMLIIDEVESSLTKLSYAKIKKQRTLKPNASISGDVVTQFCDIFSKTNLSFLDNSISCVKLNKDIKFNFIVRAGSVVCPIVIFTGNENYLGTKLLYFKKAVNELSMSGKFTVLPILITLTEKLRLDGGLDGSALTYEKTCVFIKTFENEAFLNIAIYGLFHD